MSQSQYCWYCRFPHAPGAGVGTCTMGMNLRSLSGPGMGSVSEYYRNLHAPADPESRQLMDWILPDKEIRLPLTHEFIRFK